MIQAILFDLDGTIVDTEPAAARAIVKCFKNWGISADFNDARFVTGRTWEVAFEFLFRKYPVSVPRVEAEAKILEEYQRSLQEEIPTVPGATGAIENLAAEFQLALVSGSSRSQIEFALKSLRVDRHFRFFLGAEDYPRSKPAPDGYARAIERLGLRPENCLVFEDSEPGILSALGAGAWVVAVAAANHFGHDTSKAHAQLQDLTGVNPDWVRAIERTLVS